MTRTTQQSNIAAQEREEKDGGGIQATDNGQQQ